MVGFVLLFAQPARAREGWRGFCEDGNFSVTTSGISSTTKVQRSFPQCQVLVLVHGGGVATIYRDNNNTPLANPFQANLDGSWIFYANDGRYDIQITQGSGLSFTYLDVLLCDPFVPGAVCAAGSAGAAHNLLSTTHLDTIPASPPTRGDLVTAQNQTSPTGVTPAWARLPLGTAGQVLLSNGIDALWGNLVAGTNVTIVNSGSPAGSTITINSTAGGGGSGCAIHTVDTGVMSEHPLGNCYDSVNWTWNDAAGKQNMQQGLSNVVGSPAALVFNQGNANNTCSTASATACSEVFVQGDTNQAENGGNSGDTFKAFWQQGRNNFATGNITDSYQIGGGTGASTGNSFTTDSTSSITATMCLIQGCSQTGGGINATSGAALSWVLMAGAQQVFNAQGSGVLGQDVFLTGAFSTITLGSSAGDTSLLSSVFAYGEAAQITDTGNSGFQDYYQLGNNNNPFFGSATQQAVSASFARYMVNVGFTNTFLVNGGNNEKGMFVFGDKESLTNCAHCFLIGENGVNTTSNIIGIGLSATPEIQVKVGSIKTNAPIVMDPSYLQQINVLVSALNSCNSGLKGAMDAVSDSTTTTIGGTVVGGGSNSVQVYCNGTNWIVSGGGTASTIGPGTANTVAIFTGSTTIGNSSVTDDGTNPTRAPNGANTALNGNYDEWVVDTGGVTANKLACRSSSNKVQICATSTTQGVMGVALTTQTSGQTVKICWAAHCAPITTNNTTVGHWLIPSTSVAGDVDDTGSATEPSGTQTFLAESTAVALAQVQTTILSPDTAGANSGRAGPASANYLRTNPGGQLLAGDFPDVKIIPAANCPNAVAGSGWSYATSTYTAACRAGSNNLGGALQLAPNTGGAAQFLIELPQDWDTGSQPFINIYYGSGANTSGTVIWTVSTACQDVSTPGGATDDPAFHAESAFSTQTMAVANRSWFIGGQLTAATSGNGCKALSPIIFKVTLSGTASSAINVYQAVVTIPRSPVVQAN